MIRAILGFIITAVVALGQTRPEFEVASIKPANDQILQVGVGLHIDGAQVSLTALSIKDIVAMSYRVRPNQITGPDWIANQRFNIAAKIPDGGSQNQVREMLQTLLADRFQMKMHEEMREFPVYALGIVKGGLKITALPEDPESDYRNNGPINIAAGGTGEGAVMNLGKGTSLTLGASSFEAKKLDMPMLADLLSRFTDKPVVDMTDLKGLYDFTLELTPEDRTAMLIRAAVTQGVVLPPQALRALDFGSTDSLTRSFQKLGFTFESRRAPLKFLVIDSIQKTPTEN